MDFGDQCYPHQKWRYWKYAFNKHLLLPSVDVLWTLLKALNVWLLNLRARRQNQSRFLTSCVIVLSIHSKLYFYLGHFYGIKKVREKSRECHNHKPQPFPDPKRKRKPTNPNKHKSNKRTKSTKISSLLPKRGNRNTKRTEKHNNKITHGKTYNKSPRRINHKATKPFRSELGHKTDPQFINWHMIMVRGKKKIPYTRHVVMQTILIRTFIKVIFMPGLSDLYHIQCGQCRDRGHPLNSIDRVMWICKQQVKDLVLSGGYIYNLDQTLLFSYIQNMLSMPPSVLHGVLAYCFIQLSPPPTPPPLHPPRSQLKYVHFYWTLS